MAMQRKAYTWRRS